MSKVIFVIGLIVSIWASAKPNSAPSYCKMNDPNCTTTLKNVSVRSVSSYSNISRARACDISPPRRNRFSIPRDNGTTKDSGLESEH